MNRKINHEQYGFIGLGSIGLPIAINLVSSGFKLNVHTKSRIKEKHELLDGAIACSNAKETAKDCKFLFVCVTDDEAVEEVIFGKNGAIESLRPGSILIDLSTISPYKSRSIANRLGINNVDYVDAPVTGGTEGAKEGSLTMFLGCDEQYLKRLMPALKPIAKYFYPLGGIGKGQEVKAINQILVAGNFAALAEAIALGEALNLPMHNVMKALSKGAGDSWALQKRSSSMIEDKYPLGFKLGLHHKDLCIATKTAREVGLELPLTSKIKYIEKTLIAEGYSNNDLSILRKYHKTLQNK